MRIFTTFYSINLPQPPLGAAQDVFVTLEAEGTDENQLEFDADEAIAIAIFPEDVNSSDLAEFEQEPIPLDVFTNQLRTQLFHVTISTCTK